MVALNDGDTGEDSSARRIEQPAQSLVPNNTDLSK
jgi:hypothetical protein